MAMRRNFEAAGRSRSPALFPLLTFIWALDFAPLRFARYREKISVSLGKKGSSKAVSSQYQIQE
jgi:hypothetical protein